MLRWIFNVLSLLLVIIMNGCSSTPIVYQDKEGIDEKLSSAYKNKQEAFICSSGLKISNENNNSEYTCGTFKVLNNSFIFTNVDLETQSLKKDNNDRFTAFKENIILVYLPKSGEKIQLLYTHVKNNSNENSKILCNLKGYKSNILEISTDDKYDIKMIDGSQITGEISGINLSNGDLLINTKIKTYTIKSKLITSISASTVSINLVLIDGSQLKGILVREDSNGVCIKNILGEETFPREKIHKIIYLK